MCDAGFGLSPACAACITYAWRFGALNARGKKLSCSIFIVLDTQGRGVHGPDERGLERLFTHNVKLYNCAEACAEQSESSIRSLKPPDQRSKGICAWQAGMVNII